eukprot:3254225-Rhodomonas_salina.3
MLEQAENAAPRNLKKGHEFAPLQEMNDFGPFRAQLLFQQSAPVSTICEELVPGYPYPVATRLELPGGAPELPAALAVGTPDPA